MSSQQQIEANRRNSQFSTGPRTPDGKAISRFNALKSGIHAKAQVIPGEDPAELEALVEGYHQEWAPASSTECFLVDALIRADWLLRRLSRIEAEAWTHEIVDARKSTFAPLDEDSPLGHIYGRMDDRFTRLQRRIDSTERSYYRALTQLQRLRNRQDIPEHPSAHPSPQPPAPTSQPAASNPQSSAPGPRSLASESATPGTGPQVSGPRIGFVPQGSYRMAGFEIPRQDFPETERVGSSRTRN